MDKNEEIYRWVAAWIKGELTPEDEAELACWLKQDPKNQEWFDTFTTRENLKGALSLYASFHTAKRWEELERYCRITNRRKIHPGYWRYVAAVVILFIIGGIGFLYFVPDTRKEMTLAAVIPGNLKISLSFQGHLPVFTCKTNRIPQFRCTIQPYPAPILQYQCIFASSRDSQDMPFFGSFLL